MADKLTSIEKYHQGIPLTPELEAMRDGLEPERVQASEKPKESAGRPSKIEKELTRAERLDLKETITSDGWGIFLRLIQKADLIHQKSAISMSQNDPLANAQKIAEQWAYYQTFQRAFTEMIMLAKAEVAQLEEKKETSTKKATAKKK